MSFTQAIFDLPAGKRYVAKKEQAAVRKATRDNILLLLGRRFGDIPKAVVLELRRVKTKKKLDELLVIVNECRTLEAFVKALEAP